MREKKKVVLNTLRDTLRFHESMGIDAYPLNEEIRTFLRSVKAPKKVSAVHAGTVQEGSLIPHGIESLAEEINGCTLCHLSDKSIGRVHGKGKFGSRLMIVGDWSLQSGGFESEVLFNKEEDVMLWKMMAAIELHSDQVYVTNALKCCPEDPGMIDLHCEEACFSFLAREIAAVKPKVICAMGEIAVRVIMGKKGPLARLRGRFGRYRYQSGETVMVMPTFHPRFLLQHLEMKKATWSDLLAIKRSLDNS